MGVGGVTGTTGFRNPEKAGTAYDCPAFAIRAERLAGGSAMPHLGGIALAGGGHGDGLVGGDAGGGGVEAGGGEGSGSRRIQRPVHGRAAASGEAVRSGGDAGDLVGGITGGA
jgi:hypothetical protein